MAKIQDKNKLLLTISAILMVIAIVITIVATVYEKNAGKTQTSDDSTTAASTTETTINETKKTPTETEAQKAPETTKPKTTTPVNSTEKTGKYTVATQEDPLSIRLNATNDTTVVGTIPKGTEIEILAVYDKWGYVNYNGTGGWVKMEYVKLVSASTEQPKNSTGKYKVSESGNVNISVKAEIGAPTDGNIPAGTEVEVISVCGDWGYMKHGDKMGWLPFDSLKKVS